MPSGVALPPGEAARRRAEREKLRAIKEHEVRALARSDATAAQKQRYLKGVATWGTVTAGCKEAKTTRATVFDWRSSDPEFVQAEEQAHDALVDSMEAEAYRRSVKGVQRPVYQAGVLAGYVTEYSDLLLQLLLRANRPEKYREKNDVQVAVVIKSISGVAATDVL